MVNIHNYGFDLNSQHCALYHFIVELSFFYSVVFYYYTNIGLFIIPMDKPSKYYITYISFRELKYYNL